MSMSMVDKLNGVPSAYAEIKGSDSYPEIQGMVYFFEMSGGSIVVAEIYGLPDEGMGSTGEFFGFHIHEGSTCTGNEGGAFSDTLIHYSPEYAEHPYHLGDLPVLLSSNGTAWSAIYTGRFYPEQVIGRTVVIHGHPDDYQSQPFGHAGEKMACGEIKDWRNRFSVNLLGE
jgi:Cu-Zn family superoxide dismutase